MCSFFIGHTLGIQNSELLVQQATKSARSLSQVRASRVDHVVCVHTMGPLFVWRVDAVYVQDGVPKHLHVALCVGRRQEEKGGGRQANSPPVSKF